MKRIGILTAGGDTPALNATIAGAVDRANQLRVEVFGVIKGFSGLLNPEVPHVHLNPLFHSIPELDPTRCQERAHAILSELAVDVLSVVSRYLEGSKRLTAPLGPFKQEVVEHSLPGRRVHLRRLGEDAVEIEQAGGDSRG